MKYSSVIQELQAKSMKATKVVTHLLSAEPRAPRIWHPNGPSKEVFSTVDSLNSAQQRPQRPWSAVSSQMRLRPALPKSTLFGSAPPSKISVAIWSRYEVKSKRISNSPDTNGRKHQETQKLMNLKVALIH